MKYAHTSNAPLSLFVTGGAGFIGSHFVRKALKIGHRVLNLDALTYAAAPSTLNDCRDNPSYTFIHGQIENKNLVSTLLNSYQPDCLLNFAAETHVDRSIDGPDVFIKTNIEGTFVLLEAFRDYSRHEVKPTKFIHISTDEVFGSVVDAPFQETSPYNPSSPYAASKAASDHLVRAYHKTYNLPALITNCTNNYGPYQFPEKLIPHMILCALSQKKLPLYGDGKQKRNWLHVEDHVAALLAVMQKGEVGTSYNIAGPGATLTNKDLVLLITEVLDQLHPLSSGKSYKTEIMHVEDRPGHDRCYDLDASHIEKSLSWEPQIRLEEGLRSTIKWYIENTDWWKPLLEKNYKMERLGRGR